MLITRSAGAIDRRGVIDRSATDWLTADWEAAVTDGLILLGFLAIIFAIALTRGRRRLGMAVTGRVFAMAVCGFAIVVLILWVTQRR